MIAAIYALMIGVGVLVATETVSATPFDRQGWLYLYDSGDKGARGIAIAYAYGMANGLTISEAYDCAGVEMSADQLAETVASIVRRGVELKLAVPLALSVHRCRVSPGSVFDRK